MELDIIYSKIYADVETICKRVKEERLFADEVGAELAEFVPNHSVLIPTPSHLGYPTYTYIMAVSAAYEARKQGKKVLVFPEVKCWPRESLCAIKQAGGQLPAEIEFSVGVFDRMKLTDLLSYDYIPIVLDNVIDTGMTAKAMQKAVGAPCKFMCIGTTERYKTYNK